MPKICDHTSVGMVVRKDGRLLLIERKKPPIGFAFPAGHVDNDPDFETAAIRELKEEVNLDTRSLRLMFDGRLENPCRRQDGTWHHWRIYEVEWYGQVVPNPEEAKQVRWVDQLALNELALRTQKYLDHQLTDAVWEASPGLEPLCLEIFPKIGVM